MVCDNSSGTLLLEAEDVRMQLGPCRYSGEPFDRLGSLTSQCGWYGLLHSGLVLSCIFSLRGCCVWLRIT